MLITNFISLIHRSRWVLLKITAVGLVLNVYMSLLGLTGLRNQEHFFHSPVLAKNHSISKTSSPLREAVLQRGLWKRKRWKRAFSVEADLPEAKANAQQSLPLLKA